MNTDYSISIIAAQRQQDLAAEAAAERLARVVAEGREPWWRRWSAGSRLPRRARSTRPVRRPAEPRVAH